MTLGQEWPHYKVMVFFFFQNSIIHNLHEPLEFHKAKLNGKACYTSYHLYPITILPISDWHLTLEVLMSHTVCNTKHPISNTIIQNICKEQM